MYVYKSCYNVKDLFVLSRRTLLRTSLDLNKTRREEQKQTSRWNHFAFGIRKQTLECYFKIPFLGINKTKVVLFFLFLHCFNFVLLFVPKTRDASPGQVLNELFVKIEGRRKEKGFLT